MTPGTPEDAPMTGNASGRLGRNPSQSHSAARVPSAAAASSPNRLLVYPSNCSNREATGGAAVPPNSTRPAARIPPAIGVMMKPPSGVHTGRVSSGGGGSEDVAGGGGGGDHCTWYPRSVSRGTGSPHVRARMAECAPAATTATAASTCVPLAAVTRTTAVAPSFGDRPPPPPLESGVKDVTRPPPLPSPHRISPPFFSNPSAMALSSAAGSRRNHPSGNHHAPPAHASGAKLGSSCSTPDASSASMRRSSPRPSRRSAAVATLAGACTSFCSRR
mmetsp:Transcript_7316/g.18136  ORF Transcript_7316/g.18136 Transcript_7316/m.18136 type:complete len:275 (+) Transcript_7316:725-1549(+)